MDWDNTNGEECIASKVNDTNAIQFYSFFSGIQNCDYQGLTTVYGILCEYWLSQSDGYTVYYYISQKDQVPIEQGWYTTGESVAITILEFDTKVISRSQFVEPEFCQNTKHKQ